MATGGRLMGKSTVITGANQGIGRAIALAFAAQGADLFLTDIKTERLEELAQAARRHGIEAEWRQADVTRAGEIDATMAAAEAKFGKIDVLVNNAGIWHSEAVLDYREEDWSRVMAVNVTGTFLASQAALRRMVPRRSGKLVNLASIAGKQGSKFAAAYIVSKHAVIGLTRAMASEMAEHGINVNAICPGLVDTDMFDGLLDDLAGRMDFQEPERLRHAMLKGVPLGRMIQPEEIASLAVYLASEESDGMTGQALTLSGGRLMA